MADPRAVDLTPIAPSCSAMLKGMATRDCKGVTKSGKQCKAVPLKDTDYCLAHADEKTRVATGFGAKDRGNGRPRKQRVVDVIRERIEDKVDEMFAILWEAAHAERAVVVGNGPQAYVEMVPDHPTRRAAVAELLDRGYGRPHQSSEVTVITEDVITQAIAKLEAELGGNDPVGPGDPGGDGRALQDAESSA